MEYERKLIVQNLCVKWSSFPSEFSEGYLFIYSYILILFRVSVTEIRGIFKHIELYVARLI